VDITVREQAQPQPQPMAATQEPLAPLLQPLNFTDLLELEFEHLNVEPEPRPIEPPAVPELLRSSVPIDPIAPPSLPPVASLIAAAEANSAWCSPAESASVQTLKDMGFCGDLLIVLRRNRGDLSETIRELLDN